MSFRPFIQIFRAITKIDSTRIKIIQYGFNSKIPNINFSTNSANANFGTNTYNVTNLSKLNQHPTICKETRPEKYNNLKILDFCNSKLIHNEPKFLYNQYKHEMIKLSKTKNDHNNNTKKYTTPTINTVVDDKSKFKNYCNQSNKEELKKFDKEEIKGVIYNNKNNFDDSANYRIFKSKEVSVMKNKLSNDLTAKNKDKKITDENFESMNKFKDEIVKFESSKKSCNDSKLPKVDIRKLKSFKPIKLINSEEDSKINCSSKINENNKPQNSRIYSFPKLNNENKLIKSICFTTRRFYSNSANVKKKTEFCVKKKENKKCKFFKVKHCGQRKRFNCEKQHMPCVKKEAPYKSFNDYFKGFTEEPPSECILTQKTYLQPKNQVSSSIKLIAAPYPALTSIDPYLEYQCYENLKCKKKIKYETIKKEVPVMKLQFCKPRKRMNCNKDYHPCKKLEAPYESFSDKCPQFPFKEPSECNMVETYKREAEKKHESCKKFDDYKIDNTKCDFKSGEPKKVKKKT